MEQRPAIPANQAIVMAFPKGADRPVQIVASVESAQQALVVWNSYLFDQANPGMAKENCNAIETRLTLDAYVGGQPRKSTMVFNAAELVAFAIDVPSTIVRASAIPDLGIM